MVYSRSVVLSVVLWASLAASGAHGEEPSTVIIDAVTLRAKGSLWVARQQLDSELGKVAQTVMSDLAGCHSDDCLPGVAATYGAKRVVLLTGGPNDEQGFDLRVEVWSPGAVRTTRGACNFCVTAEMADLATKLVRDGLAMRAVAEPPARAPQLDSVAAPERQPGFALPIAIGGAGLAIGAVGITLWALDGDRSGNCRASYCSPYHTRLLGEVLTGIGAAGIIVGGVLAWRAIGAERDLRVGIGPGSIAFGGVF